MREEVNIRRFDNVHQFDEATKKWRKVGYRLDSWDSSPGGVSGVIYTAVYIGVPPGTRRTFWEYLTLQT